MYEIIAKHENTYAVMLKATMEVEAFTALDLEFLLQMGVHLEGASLSSDGSIQFSPSIEEFNFDEVDNTPEIEDDDMFFEDDDDDMFFEEDDDEIYEDEGDIYEDEDLISLMEEQHEESVVEKLYNHLSNEQVKLLKRYYLWYSRRIFSEAQKDPTLGMKDAKRIQAKKADLKVLRDTGGLWEYAGFIDTGYDGGGECTMGHKLRYMHLAWDVSKADLDTAFFGEGYNKDIDEAISSNNCIVFGIKCVSDFFEVDKDCMQSLQRAQRESLKDMEEICQLYNDGLVKENVNSFGLMDEFMKKVTAVDAKEIVLGSGELILPQGLHEFYGQFRKANMPVPRSLIYEIRNKFMGFANGKYYSTIKLPQPIFKVNLGKLWGTKFDKTLTKVVYKYSMWDLNPVASYLFMLFGYKVTGCYEYDGVKNTYEGGKSEKVRYAFGVLNRQSKSLFKDYEYSITYCEKVMGYIDSLLTLEEEYKESGCVDDTIDNDLSRLRRGIFFRGCDKISDEFKDIIEDLKERIKNMDKEEPVVQEEKLDIFEYLKQADLSMVDKQKFKFNLEVLETCKKYNNASEKQLIYLIPLYEELSGTLTPSTLVKKAVIKDLGDCIDTLPKGIGLSVLETLLNKGGTPSSKQWYHVQKLYIDTPKAHNESLNLIKKYGKGSDIEEMLKSIIK